VKPLELPLLADENIHPDVILALRSAGKDITTVRSEGLGGQADVEVLRRAHALGRVVLTHDGDFGTLAINAGEAIVGIVHLRPGHISAQFVLEMLTTIESAEIDVCVPFIVVAERKATSVRVRIRHIGRGGSP
jgi:predicted nuclease of predicted toxin-antitoxin system